jgi:hypothetical protein
VTVRLVGCATVTAGAGAAACGCCLSPQPDNAKAVVAKAMSRPSALTPRRELVVKFPVLSVAPKSISP